MDIQWEDPPDHAHVAGSNKRVGRYAEFASALKERPSAWAKMPLPEGKQTRTEASAKGLAQNIYRGEVKAFPKGQFEAAVHGSDVWVRFIGTVEPKASDSADEEEESPDVLPESPEPDPALVRQWAQDEGLQISRHGRLPSWVIDRYKVAKRRGEIKPAPAPS